MQVKFSFGLAVNNFCCLDFISYSAIVAVALTAEFLLSIFLIKQGICLGNA